MTRPDPRPQNVIGSREQWQPFFDRNEEFFKRFEHLREALQRTFSRQFNSGVHEVLIYSMGRICVDEFFEIMILAGNGYGIGALKLLRAMYERAVTMTFLAEHPENIQKFIDFHYVAERKLLRSIEETVGLDAVPKPQIEETERQYQRVKRQFLITSCAACGTERMNHTWHTLDFVSMAKATRLRDLLFAAYYLPMSHLHSTMRAVITRVDRVGDAYGFNSHPQPKEADQAFSLAHDILLCVIEVQMEYFELQSEVYDAWQVCLNDFLDSYGKNRPQSPTP